MAGNVVSLISACLVLAGALFSLVAALGLLRLPDLFSRMHAASKAGTAGSGLILLAVALDSGDAAIWLKCVAAIFFFVLTAPLSAHLLAKAARAAGYRTNTLHKTDNG